MLEQLYEQVEMVSKETPFDTCKHRELHPPPKDYSLGTSAFQIVTDTGLVVFQYLGSKKNYFETLF